MIKAGLTLAQMLRATKAVKKATDRVDREACSFVIMPRADAYSLAGANRLKAFYLRAIYPLDI